MWYNRSMNTHIMRIYVAGPMRGIPEFNFPAFAEGSAQLRALGHEVFSPAERDIQKHGKDVSASATGDLADIAHTGFSLRDALGADTAWICEKADAVALLPGWENSSGAKAEAALGKALGIRVDLIETFIGKKHDKSRLTKRSGSS